ncbi:MAG: CorA family divalent cation transporter [Chitinophagales bacterium]
MTEEIGKKNPTSEEKDSKDYCSSHIFLFPFKWEYKTTNTTLLSFKEKTNIDSFRKLLEIKKNYSKDKKHTAQSPTFPQVPHWQHHPFRLDSAQKFNEYNYFYDFVREVMYDLDTDLQPNHTPDENILYHFEYQFHKKKALYKINIQKNETPYDLEIDSIILNIYNTGVGVFSFHLKNYKYPSSQSILDINQYGRRIYPPFLSENNQQLSLEQTFNAELAVSVSLEGIHEEAILEDFSSYTQFQNIQKDSFLLPKHIKNLLGSSVVTRNDSFANLEEYILLSPVVDDRMFVVSWYKNADKAAKLGKFRSKKNAYNYLRNSFWHQYLFVDANGPSCKNNQLFTQLTHKHTYNRWAGYGTLYGVCRYAFVAIESGTFIRSHIEGIYYKMVEFSLVQRASILRFSDEVTHVSDLELKKESRSAHLTQEIKELYQDYIRFVNKVYFREITAQEQGIDLYNKLQENMNIERQVKDLENEIEELHSYSTLIESQKRQDINQQRQVEQEEQNKAINRLTILGAALLLPTFIAGYYGMNVFDGQIMEFDKTQLEWATFAFLLTPVLLLIIFVMNGKNTIRKIVKNIINWFYISEEIKDRSTKFLPMRIFNAIKHFFKKFLFARFVATIGLVFIIGLFLSYPIYKGITQDNRIPTVDTTKVEVVKDVSIEELQKLEQQLQNIQQEVVDLKTIIADSLQTSTEPKTNN